MVAGPNIANPAAVPSWYWATVLFVLGTIVGSFLNVCIYRMPRGESIISPRSRCPHCGYQIPWALNIPLVTWLYLRGKCRNCRAPISVRYFLVELLCGLVFLASWLAFGSHSVPRALVYCLLFSLFIVASFIDFEYYIIPDEITLGGLAAGFLCSFAVPSIQHATSSTDALLRSLGGIILGSGLVYLILRGGKVLFGRQRFSLPADTTVTFTETVLKLPDRDVPYEELFYRKSDAILFRAKKLELFLAKSHHATSDLNPPTASSPPSKDIIPTNPPDESPEETAPRPDATGLVQPAATGPGATLASESAPPPHTGPGPAEIPKSDASQHADHTFDEVLVRLTPHELCVGETIFKPDEVTRMIAVAEEMVLPREAMGLGDVKFMASIGAFLGAPAVLFSLLLSAMIGSLVGVTLIVLRRREWSSRLPYGPYLALAAMIWVFGSIRLHNWWVDQLNLLLAATGIAR